MHVGADQRERMKHHQSGITLLSFVVVLAAVGFVLYVGVKLFPMYQEYYAVRTVMKSLAKQADSAELSPEQARELFFRRLDINNSESVGKDDIQFERVDGGLRMKVAYEVRRPLLGNLDVVGKFESTQELSRHSGDQ